MLGWIKRSPRECEQRAAAAETATQETIAVAERVRAQAETYIGWLERALLPAKPSAEAMRREREARR